MQGRIRMAAALLALAMPAQALADPKDESQRRTMTCSDGSTVEAIIQRSNTGTLHVTTSTSNFVIKYLERDGQVIQENPGWSDKPMVRCETVGFNLVAGGFFT